MTHIRVDAKEPSCFLRTKTKELIMGALVASWLSNLIVLGFADSVNFFNTTATVATNATNAATNSGIASGVINTAQNVLPSLPLNPTTLLIGIVLIAVTIFLIFFLKKILINSILGVAMWAFSVYFLHIHLPLIPSFVISVIFGPAGVGAMLVLAVFGLIVV